MARYSRNTRRKVAGNPSGPLAVLTSVWRPGDHIALLAGALALLLVAGACQGDTAEPVEVEGGDPERGRAAIEEYGCGSCHNIPGVDGADGRVAPGLQVWPNRAYVAGVLPNEPENVITFIQEPREVSPNSAMPNLGVSESDARDIAAYLFTLG